MLDDALARRKGVIQLFAQPPPPGSQRQAHPDHHNGERRQNFVEVQEAQSLSDAGTYHRRQRVKIYHFSLT